MPQFLKTFLFVLLFVVTLLHLQASETSGIREPTKAKHQDPKLQTPDRAVHRVEYDHKVSEMWKAAEEAHAEKLRQEEELWRTILERKLMS